MSESSFDAIVIGSGPNGFAAAIVLAEAGLSVKIVEAKETIGGGTRTAALTIDGFRHDVCSAIHPMGILSPVFRSFPLKEHGLEWLQFPSSVAHPLPDGRVALIKKSLDETAASLGKDEKAYRNLFSPFLKRPHELFNDLMSPPIGIPKLPFSMARFGFYGLRSARCLAEGLFEDELTRALFAGCAGHSILPLERTITAAVGMIFCLTGHIENWACAKGGSEAIAKALASYFESLGGQIETKRPVTSLEDLEPARSYLFDLSPAEIIKIAGSKLPSSYIRRLERFNYGPATFKVDWALSGAIPWKAEACKDASTVHVGGTLNEIAAGEAAVWRGEHPEKPFLLVCQQSQVDESRAPKGKHTGYAYCHVPSNSTVDMTERIEAQIERFAPGFRELILAKHSTSPKDFEAYNSNYVGGAITGGAANLMQFIGRPVLRLNPYSTPNPQIFICSASTPPGGGVHGMCGYHAARTALRRLGKNPI